MKPPTQPLGAFGENIAVRYLKDRGYAILGRNFFTRYAEIDIIAQDGYVIVFVEVKTRVGDRLGKPYESVNPRKIEKIKRSAYLYCSKNNLNMHALRLDVISIELFADKSLNRLLHFKGVDV